MLKRPWLMSFATAGIAAVIGLMLVGRELRTKPAKSNGADNNRPEAAGSDRTSMAGSKPQPANPADDETENSDSRESSRHVAGEVAKNRLQQERRKLESKMELQRTRMQMQSQLGSLLKYDGAQLAVYATGLDLPDNPVREIYPKYLEEKRKHEELKLGGMGDAHPTVRAQKEKLDGLMRELDEGVVKLRESLSAQLKALEDSPPKAKD